MYPDSTACTPFSSSKTASRHQKQPPARVAISWDISRFRGWLRGQIGSNFPYLSASNKRAFTNMAQTTRPPRRPTTREPLAEQAISREVLLEKYAKDAETSVAEVRARVA